MRVGVIGTGVVGQTLGSKLVELGHEVKMGSRRADNEKAAEWVVAAGPGGSHGTFADAAGFGQVVVNATGGTVSLDALQAAGAANLSGKVLVDVSNPLDFSRGFPPSLAVCNTDSVAEQIQRAFPEARVVKTLNTVNADVMVNPAMIPGGHAIFVCGNDAGAKAEVSSLLRSFGWGERDIVDLGDISGARGAEMYLPLWLRLLGHLHTGHFNIRVVREG
jgi:predicted dinucleotide-binding enzyme